MASQRWQGHRCPRPPSLTTKSESPGQDVDPYPLEYALHYGVASLQLCYFSSSILVFSFALSSFLTGWRSIRRCSGKHLVATLHSYLAQTEISTICYSMCGLSTAQHYQEAYLKLDPTILQTQQTRN